MASIIRHIATGNGNNDVFVTAEFERVVTIWSFKNRRKVAELHTWLDFGGQRLSLVGGDNPKIAVGAYNRYGVSLYDAMNGELLWQRSDLKGIQFVSGVIIGSGEQVGVGRENGPFHILDTDTGETKTVLRGVKKLYSSSTEVALGTANAQLVLMETSNWSPLWKLKSDSKSPILDAAFGNATVAVSYMSGPIRFFDMKGNVNGEYYPGEDSHIVNVAWCNTLNLWACIKWNFSDSTMSRLLVDAVANLVDATPIGGHEHAFFDSGRYVITSDGEIRSTQNDELVWGFQ